MPQGLDSDIYLLNVCCCSKVSFTHHLRQPCSSVLTCRSHDELIKIDGDTDDPVFEVKDSRQYITRTESQEIKGGDVYTSTIFRAALKSSCALCQKKKKMNDLIVLSKCNSAILS